MGFSHSSSAVMSSGRNYRFPFTDSQWQELEHQALILKYIISGTPIPPDLIFTVKTSLESSLSSNFIFQQPQPMGWNCYPVGLGRKIDPEPGRCRRTDGKKWRCSKEAYPDSKYCERHMHRGRNRSRKPVEAMPTTTSTSTTSTINHLLETPTSTATPISSSISPNPSTHHHSHPGYHPISHLHHHPFPYPYSSSSSRPHLVDFSPQEGAATKPDKDYYCRSGGGMKEGPGSSTEGAWQLTPLVMNNSSLAHLKGRAWSDSQNGYPFLQLQGFSDDHGSKQEQEQHFSLLGGGEDDRPHKVMHHFIDEWPKNKDSWADSEDKSSSYVPVLTTQLSISIPSSSSHDFFLTQSGD
ncbi:growth-regulating factor 1 isoform X2 [Diospyros lotus]|uniref:growth-regulating factor 1 isoform X2 n=1 Tax=Diospyros lotus TaxID=55363 RepID=UPI00225C3289|nr:growth-regulating factor 1 isoform X2 [Diospyros lotus]